MKTITELLQKPELRSAIKREIPSLANSTISRLQRGKFQPRYSTQQAILKLFERETKVEYAFADGMRVKHKLCGEGTISKMGNENAPYSQQTAYVQFKNGKWGWVFLSCLEPVEEEK